LTARPYIWVAFFTALAVLALQRQLDRERPAVSWWVVFSLAGVGGVLVHPLAANVFPVFLVMAACATPGRRARVWWGLAIASIPAGIAAGWLLSSSSGQRGQVGASMPQFAFIFDTILSLSGLTFPLALIGVLIAVVGGVLFVKWVSPKRGRAGAPDAVAPGAGASGAGASGAAASWRDPAWFGALALLVLPTVALYVASFLVYPLLTDRYAAATILATPLLIGAAAGALVDAAKQEAANRSMPRGSATYGPGDSPARVKSIPEFLAPIVVLAVAAALLAPGALSIARRVHHFDDIRLLAAELQARVQPGDIVSIVKPYTTGGFGSGVAYYTGDTALAAAVELYLRTVGEPTVYERRVVSVGPDGLSTEAAFGAAVSGTMWRVSFFWFPEATPDQCTENPADLVQAGDLTLRRWTCDGLILMQPPLQSAPLPE
jgi:hypothetical protein